MSNFFGCRSIILRLTALLTFVFTVAVFACQLIGAQSPGDSISAFTTTTYETTDVWLMDVSRMKFVHLQVTGQSNNIPVWSPHERRLLFFPRTP